MRSFAAPIGIAKPRPSALVATAVLIPMTLPVPSRSGPPLLPGLIAASVWMRPLSVDWRARGLVGHGDLSVEPGDDAAGDGLGVRAERAADRDGGLADLEGGRVADGHRPQARRLRP